VSDPLTLANVLDDAAILSLEHQLHLADVLGDHNWSVDLGARRFEFSGGRTITCTGCHLLGTAAAGSRSWLWGWANESGLPPEVTALSATLRDFGRQHGIAELATAEVPFDALPGAPNEAPQVIGVLTDVAKIVSGRWTAYNGEVGGGTRVAFLVEHPEFRLPPPEPARTMRVLQQALAELRLTDHRRAVHSYAVRRPLDLTFAPDGSSCLLGGPGFEATVTFDHFNRVTNINGTLSQPRR
jgi:hypothetical protein